MKFYDIFVTAPTLFGVFMLTYAAFYLQQLARSAFYLQQTSGLSAGPENALAFLLIVLVCLSIPLFHLKIIMPMVSKILGKKIREWSDIDCKRCVTSPSILLISPIMFSVVGIFLFFLFLTIATGSLLVFFAAYPLSLLYVIYLSGYYEKIYPGMGARIQSIGKLLSVGYLAIILFFVFG